MGVALDVVIGTEVNRDNVAAQTSAIRRHPPEITTSHHKSGSSDRSSVPGTLSPVPSKASRRLSGPGCDRHLP
jgi:hypothetical protein